VRCWPSGLSGGLAPAAAGGQCTRGRRLFFFALSFAPAPVMTPAPALASHSAHVANAVLTHAASRRSP